ncbi:hypothetical protein QTN25_010361 [Entamoeba marina]
MKTISYHNEIYNATVCEWICNHVCFGGFVSFGLEIIIYTHMYPRASEEEKRGLRKKIKQQLRSFLCDVFCSGFHHVKLCAEITNKSLEHYARNQLNSLNNGIEVTFSPSEIQNIHNLYSELKMKSAADLEIDNQISCSINLNLHSLRHLKQSFLHLSTHRDSFFIRSFFYLQSSLLFFLNVDVNIVYSKLISVFVLLEQLIDVERSEGLWKTIFKTFFMEDGYVIQDFREQNQEKLKDKIILLYENIEEEFILYASNHQNEFTHEVLIIISMCYCSLFDNDVNPLSYERIVSSTSYALHLLSRVKNKIELEKLSQNLKKSTTSVNTLCCIVENICNVLVTISENSDYINLLLKNLLKPFDKVYPDYRNLVHRVSDKRQHLSISLMLHDCLLCVVVNKLTHPILQMYGRTLITGYKSMWKLCKMMHNSNYNTSSKYVFVIADDVHEIITGAIAQTQILLAVLNFSLSFEGIQGIILKFKKNVDVNISNSIYSIANTIKKGDTQETLKSLHESYSNITNIINSSFSKELLIETREYKRKWLIGFKIKYYLINLMYFILKYTSQCCDLDDFTNSILSTISDIVDYINDYYE